MVMTAALAQTSASAVKVDFCHRGEFAGESVRVDGVCYGTPMLLRRWGWDVQTREAEADVTVDGRLLRLPIREIEGRVMLDIEQAIRYAGASATWREETKTLRVRGSVRNIELTAAGIRVDATLPFQVRAAKMANPDRLIIDLIGTDLEERLVTQLPAGWRAAQFDDRTVRVVIEHPEMAKQPVPKSSLTRTLQVALRSVNPQAVAAETTPPVVKDPATIPVAKPAELSLPVFAAAGERDQFVNIPFTGIRPGSPSAKYLSPTQVQIVIPNATFAETGPKPVPENRLVTGLSLVSEGTSAVLMLDLAAPLAFEMGVRDGSVAIRIFRPVRADGKLQGKVIVVDAGHGGKDSGGKHGTVYEKNIALPIARLTSKLLGDAGASVIMTRADDTFIALGDRSKVANESDAALFISIHVNSNQVANSRSGGMTFHHMQDPVGMLLAECIQSEIAKVSKIPNMGIWSDRRIYQSGFAVLRNSKMPSVLIELGFINHSYDRARMLQPTFREDIARAIVRGVRVFLGDDK